MKKLLPIFFALVLSHCESLRIETGSALFENIGSLVVSEQIETAPHEHTITVTNTSPRDTVVFNIAQVPLSMFYHFKGADYPGEGGTCQKEIAAGESCTLVVEERLPLIVAVWTKSEDGIKKLREKSAQAWKKLRPQSNDETTQPAAVQQ